MKRLLYWIRGILFPRRCILCRTFLKEEETDLCHSCRTEAPAYPFGALNPAPVAKNKRHFLDSFTAVWYYDKDVRRSIHRFKFRKALNLAPAFGRFLAMRVLEQGPERFDYLTWVPVSDRRRRKRGYDQCEVLAGFVARELGTEQVRLLRKVRHTPPQSGIRSQEARKANVLGAFRVVPEIEICDKTILLLDDIYTTGATTEECARVLLTAGAKEVHCAVIAAVRSRK